MNYQDLNPGSRVWIYQADRILSPVEASAIQQEGNEFVRNWAAHGAALKADIKVFHQLFIIVFADESSVKASGCSIDSSVRWITETGKKYGVDFLNRMLVAYRNSSDELPALFHLNKLEELYEAGTVNGETKVFNNLVQTLDEFERSWEVKLEDSWHYQRVAS